MKTPLEKYLESAQAVEEVAALLAAPDMTPARMPSQVMVLGGHLVKGDRERWRYVAWYADAFDHEPSARVYFRAAGDRFGITDFGEAVRTAGLRLGVMSPIGLVGAALRLPDFQGLAAYCAGQLYLENIQGADLPSAIVRVMLAAHRVASMEDPNAVAPPPRAA